MRKRGFSLIELVVAVSVITIIIFISFPLLQNYQPNLKLNAVARDLASDLRQTQQQAVTEQIIYEVRLANDNNSYQVIKTTDGSIIKEVTLASGISFDTISGFDDNVVSFNATGAAQQAGTIILTNSRKTLTIEVKPSGYVKIYK